MKLLSLLASLLLVVNTFATPADSIPQRPSLDLVQTTYEPVFRITQDDIIHLPFTDIIEVINGRFPFVFSDPPSSSEYTFLVDGHLILNINAINVSQIALIEYYPVSFDVGGGALSLKGTFVITTKARKANRSGFNIRSQGGINIPNEKSHSIPPPLTREFSNDFFAHQEIGYDHVSERLQLSAGASLTSFPNVPYDLTDQAAGLTQTYNSNRKRLRASVLGGFQATKKLRLSLALAATHVQKDFNGENSNTAFGKLSDYNSQVDVPYKGLAIGVEFTPSVYFNNSLKIEYADWRDEGYHAQYNYDQNPIIHSEYFTQQKYSALAVSNTSSGLFTANGNVEFGWRFSVRYYDWAHDLYYWSKTSRPPGTTFLFNDGYATYDKYSVIVMPGLNVNVNRQFNAQAGVTYDTEVGEFNPYAGIRWFAPLRAGSKLSSLVVHSSFEMESHINYDGNPQESFSRPGSDPTLAAPVFPQDDKTGYTWITGINTGFADNKFMAALNFLIGQLYPHMDTPLTPGKVNRNGVSLDLQATLASQEQFSCKVRTLLFYERYKAEQPIPATVAYFRNPMLNDDLSPQVRGSVSVDMKSRNFFLQLQGLIRFNDEGNTYQVTAEREPVSNHGLTFLVAGYSFNIPKLSDLQCDLSIQTRNLATMKHPKASSYYASRYVGLGVNVRF